MSEPYARAGLLDDAFRVGARLCREAIWDGARCTWVGAAEERSSGGEVRTIHRAAGPSLHDGTAGIALFLGQLHALTGERAFRTTALAAVRHALSNLDAIPAAFRMSTFSGWTGIALAAAQVGECVDAPGLEDPAVTAVAGLRGRTGAEAEVPSVDVMAGSAGAIPPLLWLAARDGRDDLLEQALSEGELVRAKASKSGDHWSWQTIGEPGDPHLCGYSHGAAGIAVGLLELWAATGVDWAREVALGAFAYESARFSEAEGNWPDLRAWVARSDGGETRPAYSATWCHGAAGAALARLRSSSLTGDRALLAEAEAGLAVARSWAAGAPATSDVCLCHGSAGVGEALLTGAGALGDPSLRGSAVSLAERHLAFERDGGVLTSGLMSGAETPGLMLGQAGFGHHLLRLAASDRVPPIVPLPGVGSGPPLATRAASAGAR